jgi:hypothetical protein
MQDRFVRVIPLQQVCGCGCGSVRTRYLGVGHDMTQEDVMTWLLTGGDKHPIFMTWNKQDANRLASLLESYASLQTDLNFIKPEGRA